MPDVDDGINDRIIGHLLRFEGGFTNHPADHGGPTNFGITAGDLGNWRKLGRAALVSELQALDVATAREIYGSWYIAGPGFDAIADERLRLVVVDGGVLFGTKGVTRWLQTALGVAGDGVIGRATTDALSKMTDPVAVARRVLGLRLQHIAAIVVRDPTQIVFLAGWINRATSLLDMI